MRGTGVFGIATAGTPEGLEPGFSDCRPKVLRMRRTLKKLWQEEEGQDLVEYALIAALIALASVAALNTLATDLQNAFSNAVVNMSSTTT